MICDVSNCRLLNENVYSQVILGLCGVIVSVTGFSGAHTMKGGSVSSGFLVAGIVFIVFSLSLSMWAFVHIPFVTQDVDDDLIHFIVMVIKVEILESQQVHDLKQTKILRLIIYYVIVPCFISVNDHSGGIGVDSILSFL